MEPERRDASPTETSPDFDGQCAFAVSTGKLGVTGSAKHRLETDGQVFLFKNGAARFLWRVLPNRLEKANRVWAAGPR